MGRYVARGTQVIIDLVALSAAYCLAFLFRFELELGLEELKLLFFSLPYVVIFKYLVLAAFGVPSFSWRYVGVREAIRIFLAMLIASAVLVALRFGFGGMGWYFRYVTIPLGILLMDLTLSFLGIAGVRFVRRVVAERAERRAASGGNVERKRTLLVA